MPLRFPSTFAIIVEEVLGSTAVDNAPPQKSSDIRLGIFLLRHSLTHVRAGRYRTRTATTTTAASGRNREELLGPRSDFSRPRQGVAEKSANATRKAVSARCRFLDPLGMSTKKDAAVGAPFQPTPVRASNPNNNDQRQGIIMAMVSCLLCYISLFFHGRVWYTRLSSTNRNLQDGETYERIDTKMFMGNYRLI